MPEFSTLPLDGDDLVDGTVTFDKLSPAISTGVPVAVGNDNDQGSAEAFARSDHVHDHGEHELGDGTGHAVATTTAAGFFAPADKLRLDGMADDAAGLTSSAPVDVSKTAAAPGIAPDAARADHKHDIATAAPSSVGSVNAEGGATSLARSDHVHAHGDHELGTGTQHAVATPSTAGFMSAVDKTFLDSIVTGGDVAIPGAGLTQTGSVFDVVATDPSIVVGPDSIGVGVLQSDAMHGQRGGGTQHAEATTTAAGFLSAADKVRLDGAAALSSSAPADVTKAPAAPGVAPDAARADHKHDVATAAPNSVGTANAEGAASSLARSDHVHAHGVQIDETLHATATVLSAGFMSSLDKARLDSLAASPGGEIVDAGAGLTKTGTTLDVVAGDASIVVGPDSVAVGVLQTDVQHGDRGGGSQHAAATPTVDGFLSAADKAKLDTLAAGEVVNAGAGLTKTGTTLDVVAADASIVVGADAVGVGVLQTDAQHGDRGGGALHAVASSSVDGFMSAGDKLAHDANTTKLATVATNAAALTSNAPVDVTKAAADVGAAVDAARADHKHDIATGAPVDVGAANAEGVASSLARSDHVHAHGVQADETLHALATTLEHGFMSSVDKARLDSLAASPGGEILDAGAGLTKTGTTLDVVATDASIVVAANSLGVGVLQTDVQHGVRGGGTQHAVATAVAAGFMSAADKIAHDADTLKLATITAGADPTVATLAAAAAAISVNNQKVINLATPSAANDAANKAYVDATAQGLTVKASCKLLASANVPLSGLAGIDGITPVAGDRILCVAQTTGSANGIYVAAAGAWTRALDADTSAEVTAGMYVFITQGTGFGDTGWILTTDDPIVLGTTDLVFAQFSGTGTAVAGDGLVRSGNVFAVGAAADGSITIGADEVRVGVLATDVQHGARGGGGQHAAVTVSTNGFMIAADKVRLDSMASGAAGLTNAAPANVTAATAVPGLATDAARADHKHNVTTAAPVAIGTANTPGSATSLSLSDHVHAHGTLAGGALHALATTAVDGFMPAATMTEHIANTTKLAGIAAGAEVVAAGSGLTKTGSTLNVGATDASIVVGADSIGVGVLQSDAMHGLRGGGTQHAVATVSVAGFMSAADKTAHDANTTKLAGIAAGAEVVAAGAGLTKTGSTINAVAADASIVVSADAIAVGVLQTDAMHGTRGGATQHAVATTSVAGFMSAVDKTAHDANTTKLAGIAAGAEVVTAGAGLTKTGSALDVVAADASLVVAADSIGVGVLQSDAMHGVRGGGTQHAVATVSVNGFMPSTAVVKLAALPDPAMNGFRLAPTTDDSIPADGTFSTIYLAPVESDCIALYSGSVWIVATASGLSYTLAGRTADLPFDVFAFWTGSAVNLEVLNWSSATARATALAKQNGVWVKSGDATRRYLGTVRPRSATTFRVQRTNTISVGSAGVDYWNVNNKRQAAITLTDLAAGHTWITAAWRQWAGNANAQIDVITGVAGDVANLAAMAMANTVNTSTTLSYPAVGIGRGTTTVASGFRTMEGISRIAAAPFDVATLSAGVANNSPLGVLAYVWLEYGDTGVDFYGANRGCQSGMMGSIWY